MELLSNKYDCVYRLDKEVDMPEKFTFPFYYQPHPYALQASTLLQEKLEKDKELRQQFELGNSSTGDGKMFGVLVVETKENELGFIPAFSGKLAGKYTINGFAPPLFDLLDPNGFFKKGEQLLNEYTSQLQSLEDSPELLQVQTYLNRVKSDLATEEEKLKRKHALDKKKRDEKRKKGATDMSAMEFKSLSDQLNLESQLNHFEWKDAKKSWAVRLQQAEKRVEEFQSQMKTIQQLRKSKSASIQEELFTQYNFLNALGESVNVRELFDDIPPAGTGECAAPKMLQFAYQNDLKPICMAEFWWGPSPKSEIRKHGQFYPSCKSKCENVLGHMLQGLEVEESPLELKIAEEKELKIIFEDQDILVLEKPVNLLSVPGKEISDSVETRVHEKYPELEGPIIVHRLDMSTSGIMILAKTKEAHKSLQDQFLARTVTKRYIALLEGKIENESGTIDLPLRVDLEDRPRQLVCHEYGKKATTKYKLIEYIDGNSLVQFFPITGRTHQLRVHSAHQNGLNHPIVGDELYGNHGERLCLHADFLQIQHPTTGKKMKFKASIEF